MCYVACFVMCICCIDVLRVYVLCFFRCRVVAPYAPEFKGVFLSSCLFQHSRVGPCVIVRDRAVHGGEVYVNFSQPLAAILRRKCSG